MMRAYVLEDGQEAAYLKMEKNWQIASQVMVDNGIFVQWSVWKRTPRKDDESWADYYVFSRWTKEQIENPKDMPWEDIYKSFKSKSKKAVDNMLSNDGIVKEIRQMKYKGVASTGWLGLEWEIGDKAYFHYMTEKNKDFVDYENSLWKPVAQQQILDGYRKFWGLFEITEKNEAIKEIDFTHLAFNFFTDMENNQQLPEQDFLSRKLWEGLENSRDMLPAEELTLVYSTF
jgi:hypothetical protein